MQRVGFIAGIGMIIAVLVVGIAVYIYQTRDATRDRIVRVDDSPSAPSGSQRASPAAGSSSLSGVVLNADGRPVAAAEVLLAMAEHRVNLYGVQQSDPFAATSDNQGHFAFPRAPQRCGVVVRCSDGFAYAWAGELPADGRFVLQAWGRIEGVLRVGGKPAPGQNVVLRSSVGPRSTSANVSRGRDSIYCSQETRTDENGRFVFARVVPGTAGLFREATELLQGGGQFNRTYQVATAEVVSGTTVQLDISRKGRPVIGKVLFEPAPEEPLQLFGMMERSAGPESDAAAGTPPAGPAFVSPVAFESDGTFRANDVPPGSYTVRITSSAIDAERGGVERLAAGMLTVNIPEIPSGQSDDPFDAGAVRVIVYPRIKIGAAAPPLEAVRADGTKVALSDFRGRYVLLAVLRGGVQTPGQLREYSRQALPIQDRAGGKERLALLALALPPTDTTTALASPQLPGWTMITIKNALGGLDSHYAGSPGIYLIDPDGNIKAKTTIRLNTLYGTVDQALGLMRRHAPGVSVEIEKLSSANANPAFQFKTIPTISTSDAGQSAIFTITDGRKADFGGGIRIFNDGRGPLHETDEASMFTFEPDSVEGRIRVDLGDVIGIDRINTYAWYKDGHRWAQVYRVYGSDGAAAGFVPEPKIGTDPADCGWSLIAEVDTRNMPGGKELRNDQRGQSGVSIHGEAGLPAKYRYLLFVTFATETHDRWGQTFWSEIDVVQR